MSMSGLQLVLPDRFDSLLRDLQYVTEKIEIEGDGDWRTEAEGYDNQRIEIEGDDDWRTEVFI